MNLYLTNIVKFSFSRPRSSNFCNSRICAGVQKFQGILILKRNPIKQIKTEVQVRSIILFENLAKILILYFYKNIAFNHIFIHFFNNSRKLQFYAV